MRANALLPLIGKDRRVGATSFSRGAMAVLANLIPKAKGSRDVLSRRASSGFMKDFFLDLR